MSLLSYQKAKAILEANSKYLSMSGPKPEQIILSGEIALGLQFPPAYRKFVEEYGTLAFAGEEVYGITGFENEASSVPNAVWMTLDARRQVHLPLNYVVIYSIGNGDWSCLAVNGSGDEDCPVFTFFPGTNRKPVVESACFDDWFESLIRQGLEDVLTLEED